jgi:DNA helicase HerA-like ATPase
MHTLVIGQPEQGKTMITKIIVRQAEAMGKQAVILDPLNDEWGKNSIIVNSVEEMIEYAKTEGNENKLLVIDESSISFDRYDPKQFWVAKISRHMGHSSIFIGQNMTDVPRGVRSQCTQVFVFASSRTDAKLLADEYDDDLLLTITKLPKFHFIRIYERSAKRGYINPSNMSIMMEGSESVPHSTKIKNQKIPKKT